MRVLSYHNRSVATALLDLFPNIGLKKSNFVIVRNKKKESPILIEK
jgi:hypothetical protein